MTAQGSRRFAFCVLVAAIALLGWWAWPRHDAGAAVVPATGSAARAAAGRMAAASLRAAPGREPDAPALDVFHDGPGPSDTGEGSECAPARRARLASIRDGLDPARSAREAFAHALLGAAIEPAMPQDADAERRALARVQAQWQEARRLWPGDLDIAWQAANACTAKSGCDAQHALDHLLELDPGNAAAWWLAMRDAWQRGDVAAYDDALAHAAAARGSDARTGSVFLALQPLLARAPAADHCLRAADAGRELQEVFGPVPTAADLASAEAWSHELAGNSPVPFSAFAGCRERDAGALPPRRRSDCIASLAVLAGGDTSIEQSVALPLLIQLAGDTADGMAYRERYRRLMYLFLVAPPTLRAGDPASLLTAGEVESMRQTAIARHRWPPPAGWLPHAQGQRMLITRGRLPPNGED